MTDHSRLTSAEQSPDNKTIQTETESTRAPGRNLEGNLYKLSDIEPINYNVEEIEKFLNTVFPVELLAGEEILTYHDYGRHNRAISEDSLLDLLGRSKKPARLYFSTGTAFVDPQGELRNRLNNFARFHVLVLDDIGTKVDLEKITLDPSYIIESSPGNFQYGYVLDKPLDRMEDAQVLVDLVYSAGLSDEGGKLCMKKVRLPGGINGKRGQHQGFNVRLCCLNSKRYSPQEIIDGLGITAIWEHIVKDVAEARRRLKVAGTSHWSPIPLAMPSCGGIVDSVAEWLFENNEVINISGEWLEIKCPWHEEHSDPNATSAYYSPVGLGDGHYQQHRAFYCHHSHPEKTEDFLAWVSAEGGPIAPVYDLSAELVASCVYDTQSNTVIDIKRSLTPVFYHSLYAFQQAHCRKLMVKAYSHASGKNRIYGVPACDLWSQHPARVVVDGTTYDPSTPARIVRENGLLKCNTFAMPDYGAGAYDESIVERFLQYLCYLIPSDYERNLFIDWLACKMQDMGFRGWGMLMVAPRQRTGRGTLITMLTQLFFEENCTQIPMSRLVTQEDFNEWEAKAMVFVGESEAMSLHGHKFYAAYNKLKDTVDTTVRRTVVNTKYGKKEVRNVYTSFLLCANETLAITLDQGDQRFLVLQNNSVPAPASYFVEVREWMFDCNAEGLPKWCRHVARYLKAREVDVALMNGPAPMTDGKQEMLHASRSPLDLTFGLIFEALPGAFFPNSLIEDVIIQGGFTSRLDLDSKYAKKIIRTELVKHTMSFPKPVRIDNKSIRYKCRVLDSHLPEIQRLKYKRDIKTDRDYVIDCLNKIDMKAIIDAVHEGLETEGL